MLDTGADESAVMSVSKLCIALTYLGRGLAGLNKLSWHDSRDMIARWREVERHHRMRWDRHKE